jgi:glycosyltransferase involved in cell wall biosynthesis
MLVSVIIPSYNREFFLSDLFLSILNQNYRPIEVVLVNDGSTDGTIDVFDNFKCMYHDQDVSWRIINTYNCGAPAARNLGFCSSLGDLVIFVDSDDVIAPDSLSSLVTALTSNPGYNYAYGLVQRTDSKLVPLSEPPIGMQYKPSSQQFGGYHWHTMAALYRRTCLKYVGEWNVDLTGSQDWEFQARVKAFGGTGIFVKCLVGYWRQHNTSRIGASSFRPDYVKSVLSACELIFSHAVRVDLCDHSLCTLLQRRVFFHGVEAAAHGNTELCKQSYYLIRSINIISLWSFASIVFMVSLPKPFYLFVLSLRSLRIR